MLSRRTLLEGSLITAASTLAGCDRLTKAAREVDPMSALNGKIFLKGAPSYEDVRQAGVWNGRKPNRFPKAIVLAENQTDVIQAVRLARKNGWKVGTRSGGHSWAATHTRDDALLINLAKMRAVDVSPTQRIAVISPSTKGEELNQILIDKHKMMFPSAHGYGVGLGGFVMHGGHGWNYGVCGYGCENLIAIDVVNAKGELLHANETTNSDYLWAARGSGPGFFGVVVRMYLRTHPLPKFQRITSYTFQEPEFVELLRWLASRAESVPSWMELVALGIKKDGVPLLTLQAVVHAATEQQLSSVRALLASCPLLPKAIHSAVEIPAVLPPLTETSGFFPTGGRYVCDGAWTDAGADELIPPFLKSIHSIPTDLSFVFWSVLGTARPLPDMAYSLNAPTYLSPTGGSMDPKDDRICDEWTQSFIKDLLPFSIGGQFNDDNSIMNSEYGLARRYLSQTAHDRMKALLARYDPDKMFGYIAPY